MYCNNAIYATNDNRHCACNHDLINPRSTGCHRMKLTIYINIQHEILFKILNNQTQNQASTRSRIQVMGQGLLTLGGVEFQKQIILT